jgi:hypothetical protein
MPTTKETEKPLDTEAFWKLYDQYVLTDFRQTKMNNHLSDIAAKSPMAIRTLVRPEKNWKTIWSWIALKHKTLFDTEGYPAFDLYCGDVVVVEHEWDRDTIITHVPRRSMVCGPLLNREQSFDLFIPLFGADVIERAILSRVEESRQEIFAYVKEEKQYWE